MKCTVRTTQRGEQLTFGARGARRSSGEESDAIELFDRKGGLETIGAKDLFTFIFIMVRWACGGIWVGNGCRRKRSKSGDSGTETWNS